MAADLDARLQQVAALGEPVRRALYRFVAAQSEPVTREQAADAVGVPSHSAKFHLDRLVADRLLDADYARPAGRGGPGAGRPAKVYRRSETEVDISLPERRYDLAGRLLVRAMARAERSSAAVRDALDAVAREEGTAVGLAHRGRSRGRVTTDNVMQVLRSDGYEPEHDGDDVLLGNCPFHALAREETELVCGMNLAYLEGLTSGLDATLQPVLDPADDRCCVRLRTPAAPGV
jgi:predicted ArsR family transcriptional regulator